MACACDESSTPTTKMHHCSWWNTRARAMRGGQQRRRIRTRLMTEAAIVADESSRIPVAERLLAPHSSPKIESLLSRVSARVPLLRSAAHLRGRAFITMPRSGRYNPDGFDPVADTVGAGIYSGNIKRNADGSVIIGQKKLWCLFPSAFIGASSHSSVCLSRAQALNTRTTARHRAQFTLAPATLR